MWYLRDPRRPQSPSVDYSRQAWWGMVVLIVCWLPVATSLAVQRPQTREDHSSSPPNYAELLPPEPHNSQLAIEEMEQEFRQNSDDIIEVRMRREDFVALCQRLQLDEAQSACANDAFGRYDQQVQQIHHELLDRMMPLAREYIRAYVEGGEELARERAGDAMVAAGETTLHYRVRIKQRLDALLVELQTGLSEPQLEAYPAAIRAWRRSVMLNPQASDSGHNLAYHVDLFEVIETACQEEPGLQPLLDRQAEPPSDPTFAEARLQCLELLDVFEIEFDTLIQRRFWRTRELFLESAQAWVEGDEEIAQRTRRKHRRDWMRVYRANTNAAETLALIIQESSGADLAEVWRERYYTAYCPAMYRPKSTDLLYEWLLKEVNLAAEQQAAFEAIYGQYLDTRRQLRAATRSLLLRLTEELNLGSPAMIAAYEYDGKLPPKKAQLDQQRRALSEETNLQFRNILSGDQEAAFDQALEQIRKALLRSLTP